MNNIKSTILKGSIYTAISKYTVIVINLIVTAVLARKLPPQDFGIIALTVVVNSLFDILANAGLGPAIIQNKEVNKDDLSNLFRFSIYLALLLVTIFNLLVYPISVFYKEPRLCTILMVVSLQLFFNTLNVIPLSLLLKVKNFRLVAMNNVTASCICGVVAIVTVFCGFGIYSLLIAPVGGAFINFILTIRTNSQIVDFTTIKVKRESLFKVLNFSFFQFLFNCVNYISRNLDKILMGKFLGMQVLGYYEKSYRLMTLPISTLTNVFAPTLQPVLSDYQDDISVLNNVYNKASKLLFYAGSILAPFLFFGAHEIILVVFGAQWAPSVPVFQLLSLSVPFQMVDSLSGGILQSSNKIKYLFKSGLYCALLNLLILGMSLSYFNDISFIAGAISFGLILNFFVSIYYISKYAIKQSLNTYLRSLLKIACSMTIFSLILYFTTLIQCHYMISLFIKIICMILYTLCSGLYFGYFSAKQLKNVFNV